ncbi:MAG: DNA-directed RNA polymerase subunit omega [Anaerococcus sp.]|uniref:DNA-directed RNA polymerase subunit omega n=1 Tax=Anaerococcus sp. AGMB09787 TaxID=2922869 RepID=UPI001FB020F1|nr:DNA-directed RNA polymerase subunit omega [Anaerococcus sp. AGMB09787]MCI7238598.1 DNA-directed RNA polymerase subunit omega [Anaerococcus sp.]MDY2918375.1 DNA-directed RNA polymerase subunit omega [Anaerococcus sp.]
MNNPSFKELGEISPSRYEIAMMAAKRARRIVNGSAPLTEDIEAKPVTQALHEIMERKVSKDE